MEIFRVKIKRDVLVGSWDCFVVSGKITNYVVVILLTINQDDVNLDQNMSWVQTRDGWISIHFYQRNRKLRRIRVLYKKL